MKQYCDTVVHVYLCDASKSKTMTSASIIEPEERTSWNKSYMFCLV